VSIEQKFLKIEIKDYFRKNNLIRILDAKLKKIYRTRVQTILFSFVEDTKRART